MASFEYEGAGLRDLSSRQHHIYFIIGVGVGMETAGSCGASFPCRNFFTRGDFGIG